MANTQDSQLVVVVTGGVMMDWNLARTRRSESGGAVWDAESGECLEVIEGRGDVQAIAASRGRRRLDTAGGRAFPFRAIAGGSQTLIEDTTGRLIALFPVDLDPLKTHPSGRLWAGTSASHVYFIALERS